MKRLSIPLLLSLVLCATACERHSASLLPSHGSHGSSEAHPAPATAGAAKGEEATPKKEASPGAAPKFFEQQPAK